MAINEQKLALLEAILFTTTSPLSLEDLQRLVRGRMDELRKMLEELNKRYESPAHGIKLSDIGGYKLIVKSEYMSSVADLTPHADMSRGLLRVLSVIAYHQPIKQSDIVKVIGNRTYEYVHELVERGFVAVEKKARTRLLSTTPRFEEYFETKKEELRKLKEAAEGVKQDKPNQA
ncbi:MAG TPA: SMC-Scp complex subunit ScpB [Acidobacteriota bacterium]|nr:SMC-Scp complex subunit ScpB [Acidobacteriota bacterium]HLC67888.1 SMC-Scp complex subunit ScpB [archaeon]